MPLRIPVTLLGDHVWDPGLDGNTIIWLLAYLLHHNVNELKKLVLPMLRLDTASRELDRNVLNLDPDRVPQQQISTRRHINKALSMELLVALLLRYLDDSDEVAAGCVVRNGLPNYFAPSGEADIITHYPGTLGSPSFRALVEVSAKRRTHREFFLDQLEQTYDHTLTLIEKTGETPVYGLTINGCNVGADPDLQSAYREFVTERQLEAGGAIRLLPLYSAEFAGIMGRLLLDKTYGFSSTVLARVFDTLIDELCREPIRDRREGWMQTTCLRVIRTAKAPELDLGEPDKRPKPE